MVRFVMAGLALALIPAGRVLAQYYPGPVYPDPVPEPGSALLLLVACALAARLRSRSR